MNARGAVQEWTGTSEDEADRRLGQLKLFFSVIADSNQDHVPSEPVDETWHAVLAQGEAHYARWLLSLRLPYIRHLPGEPRPGAYETTRLAMLEAGGDPALWPQRSQGNCSGCSSDGGNSE